MRIKTDPNCEPAKWHISKLARKKFWLDIWTPSWHQGRGPYLSVGLYFFAIYRGY